MNIEYELVDRDGDRIPLNVVVRNQDLPVRVRSLRMSDGYHLIITLQYVSPTPIRADDIAHGEVLSTREIVDRLLANAMALGRSSSYLEALHDVIDYDDRHAQRRNRS